MGGMIKHIFWVAPVAVIVIVMAWFLNREQVADMRVDEASFDTSFAAGREFAATSKEEKAYYKKSRLAAQSRYSTAVVGQEQNRLEMKEQAAGVSSAAKELAAELDGGRKK
jgi:isopenicillin N synthase-like dioxygenase